MKNKKNKKDKIRKEIRDLEPIEAFEKFGDNQSETEFLTFYLEKSEPITNIGEMCQDHIYCYVYDYFPHCNSEEIIYLGKLMQEHLENLIQTLEGWEGIVDLKDLTHEEIKEQLYKPLFENDYVEPEEMEKRVKKIEEYRILNPDGYF